MTVPLGSAAYQAWRLWRRNGTLPRAGGWENQPLSLLSKMMAIEVTFNTQRMLQDENADWGDLSPTQMAIVRDLGLGNG